MWKVVNNYIVNTELVDIGIKHFMSLKQAGDMRELHNREKIIKDTSLSNDLSICNQVHGSNIEIVLNGSQIFKETDGLFTEIKGKTLGILTADCVPIFVAHKDKKFVGIIHAGWRGTQKKIIKNLVIDLIKKYNYEDLVFVFGPYLKKCCLKVGSDLGQYFDLEKRDGKCYLDLFSENRQQLIDLSVPSNNIIDSNFCTGCNNDKFFSYRKNNETNKRMIGVIEL